VPVSAKVGTSVAALLACLLLVGFAITRAPEESDERRAENHGARAPAAKTTKAEDREHVERTQAKAPPRVVTVGRGDTLARVLDREGIPRDVAHEVVESLRHLWDPRRLVAGQAVHLGFASLSEEARELRWLALRPTPEREVRAELTDSGWLGRDVERPLSCRAMHAEATIVDSLYSAAREADVPASVLVTAIRALSFDIDFARDIRVGDTVELVWDACFDREESVRVRDDAPRVMLLTLSGTEKRYDRFVGEDGRADYFDPQGRSIRKTLMRTPIDGARLTSGFGTRRHPILGYSRMHTGVDFGAPIGTPIYAAGDGVVTFRGWKGGYGRYVRIRHNSSYDTAYAHMSRYARGVGVGTRVEQGDVVGYVGSSGRSTGPHLHYEVWYDGRAVNPRTIDLPTGRVLEGDELARFRALSSEHEAERIALARGTVQTAQAASTDRTANETAR
jgi:murein DD-endopeptidase MepM/ murein hydrolase activator NlpD